MRLTLYIFNISSQLYDKKKCKTVHILEPVIRNGF